MTTYRYSTQLARTEKTACAVGRDLGISARASMEICRWLRYRNLHKAVSLLDLVLGMKRAVPYVRHTQDMGHKPGIRSGRYPIKACEEVKNILLSAEKNAISKNMNASLLKIIHLNSQKASTPKHYGRHPGRSYKRTHIEVVVAEEHPMKSKAQQSAPPVSMKRMPQKTQPQKTLQSNGVKQ